MNKRDQVSAGVWVGLFWALVLYAGAVATWVACDAVTASAQRPPIPAEQWSPRAHLWLSRAMVAEAGWHAERDHRGLAYVLARRWKRAVRRFPLWRFIDQVREYCTALGGGRRSLSPRQVWLRTLPMVSPEGIGPSTGDAAPEGWPRNAAPWSQHRARWRSVLRRADQWHRGELRDPCRGRAVAWGGDMDDPSEALEPVDCGDTANIFYGLRGGDDD